jgi:hypothetical protein
VGGERARGGGKADNKESVAALRRLVARLTGSFRVVETRLFKHIKVPIVIIDDRYQLKLDTNWQYEQV